MQSILAKHLTQAAPALALLQEYGTPIGWTVATGLTAQDLFDALPRDVQGRFKDLPRVVRRLEDGAQAIRSRTARLGSTLAGVATSGPAPVARAKLVSDLQAAREHQQQRLSSSLAALEAIRLDLLRLSAGVGDPASLTRAIDAATRAGTEVDAMLTYEK